MLRTPDESRVKRRPAVIASSSCAATMRGMQAATPARRALRVAFVTETWPPEVNGVATTVARFVEGLATRGHRVDLVRPEQAQEAGTPQPAGTLRLPAWPVPRYPDLRMGRPCVGTLMRHWGAGRPDVVHIATEGPLGWSALVAARRLGLPVTSDFRTNFDAYSAHYGLGWLERPIRALLRSFHNRCACTMVPTPALATRLAAHGFDDLEVVPRGVDTARFSPAHRSEALRRDWGLAPEAPAFGFVGRLAPEKNLRALLAAYDAARACQPAARLVLVGDGPERGALAAARPDLVFAGVRHGDDLAAHYASFDVFAFPSLTETFGNVVTEAMASGLAVLAFRHAAAALLIRDDVNGVLADPGDTARFTRQAARLAADPTRRTRLAIAARTTACDHGWDAVVGRMEALLLQAYTAPWPLRSPRPARPRNGSPAAM